MPYGEDAMPERTVRGGVWEEEAQLVDGPPIAIGQVRLEKATIRLGEMLDDLQGRLGPVLGPERPHPVDGAARAKPDRFERSPLAEQLDVIADRVESCIYRVSSIARRLELG